MAKKICEACGINQSSDMLFGVALCDACRTIYSDTNKLLEYVNDPNFINNATPNAKKVFTDKAKKYDPELIKKAAEEQRKQEERQRKLFEEEQERKRKEQEDRDAFLKENGHEGYYEYKVISLSDNRSGELNVNELSTLLNSLGRDGWHLKCAYANELGHNSTSGGVGDFSTGTNSTVEQNILILERFIRFK